MSNKQIYRVFGIPVFSIEFDFEPEFAQISNTGGEFERAEAAVEEYDEEYEEDSGFGFRPAGRVRS